MKIATFSGMVTAAVLLAASAMPVSAAVDQISLLASGTQSYSNNSTNTMFSLTDIQPAGSGVFNPFVRIQRKGSEQGYNTSNTGGTMDDTSNGPANPLIPFNTVVDNTHAINLALDYNEPGSGASPITLTNLILVVSTNNAKSGPSAVSPWAVQSIPADSGDVTLYTMSATTNNSSGNPFNIYMDANDNLASGNGGSGQADLLVRINLTGVDLSSLYDGNHFLYVYSAFGNADDMGTTQAGYEEWRIQAPGPQDICIDCGGAAPEPASLGILGLGALSLLIRRRKA